MFKEKKISEIKSASIYGGDTGVETEHSVCTSMVVDGVVVRDSTMRYGDWIPYC